MGIKGLAKLLSDEAPDSIRDVPLNSLHGRKIAVDASMAIYQFLIAIRSQNNPSSAATALTNAAGETTSHIQGLFNRTIRLLTNGIRPVYVFDGKPPQFKSGELAKRREKREKAQMELMKAKEDGNVEEEERQSKRLVRAGQKENDDCMKLLELMGVPVIKAPCEAEAQAAALARAGKVYAVATEDMDALTFATPVLLRKMTFANAKSDIQSINYAKAVEGLELTHDQFVDLCILLGCDYCDSIRGIGPKTALKLVREHGSIEGILKTVDRKKYGVPDSWVPNEKKEPQSDAEEEDQPEEREEIIPIYEQARKLFHDHEVMTDVELKWEPCKSKELTDYLVDEMGFSEERVKSNIDKLNSSFKANSKPQARMDSFFKVKPSANAGNMAAKRKLAKENSKASSKKAKTTAKKGRKR